MVLGVMITPPEHSNRGLELIGLVLDLALAPVLASGLGSSAQSTFTRIDRAVRRGEIYAPEAAGQRCKPVDISVALRIGVPGPI